MVKCQGLLLRLFLLEQQENHACRLMNFLDGRHLIYEEWSESLAVGAVIPETLLLGMRRIEHLMDVLDIEWAILQVQIGSLRTMIETLERQEVFEI